MRYIEWKGVKIYDFQKVSVSYSMYHPRRKNDAVLQCVSPALGDGHGGVGAGGDLGRHRAQL